MSTSRTLRLATRGSDLALRQAAAVEEALGRRFDVEIVEVETTGDQVRDELIHRLGKTGAFVRSLDEQVEAGDVDAAVHSMKDVPTEGDGLVVAAVPERADPADVLVTPDGKTLDELPEGATVGTSSLRRTAQLLAERPDLDVQPLRGNVDTRIEKLLAPSLQAEHEDRSEAEKKRKATAGETVETPEGDEADVEVPDDWEFPYEEDVEEWFSGLREIERQALGRDVDVAYDAIVLARAGLERAGLLHHVEAQSLPTETFVPAPGQGALAVTAVDGDLARDLNGALDHPRSRVETTVERTILGELGGGCVAPLGVYAVLQGSVVRTTVRALSRDGEEEVSLTRDLPADRHGEAARELARDLADQGARELIKRAKRESGAAAEDDAATAAETSEE
ncbi:hydroxymethylbilane synthase [Halomicrobium urmianum]|uniref:hydroxymethylbilane synthase n=1 Tax=Halomicrobium urmianum TaxID=1586233 RepID=UPI001CD9D6A8|nr:hydroxymethylbilane synthase [Halomicrobium urmianum]